MQPGALPLRGRQALQERQRLFAAAAERGDRLARVVAEILPLLGQTVLVPAAELGLVHRHDQLEPVHEPFFRVAEMAEAFHGRPVLRVRSFRQRDGGLPLDRRGQVVRGARHARELLLVRLLRDLFHRRHVCSPRCGRRRFGGAAVHARPSSARIN
jgi:hypothetical protein